MNNIAQVLLRKPFFDTLKANEAEYFVDYVVSNQVVHLRRNEYNSQFVFFVEMNIMAITERSLIISKNDNYDQLQTNRNDYDSHFKVAFSLRNNSGLCGLLLNSDLQLIA